MGHAYADEEGEEEEEGDGRGGMFRGARGGDETPDAEDDYYEDEEDEDEEEEDEEAYLEGGFCLPCRGGGRGAWVAEPGEQPCPTHIHP